MVAQIKDKFSSTGIKVLFKKCDAGKEEKYHYYQALENKYKKYQCG